MGSNTTLPTTIAMEFDCYACTRRVVVPGALLFFPAFLTGIFVKQHVCIECTRKINLRISGNYEKGERLNDSDVLYFTAPTDENLVRLYYLPIDIAQTIENVFICTSSEEKDTSLQD
jgi:hypothetical protein